MCAVCDLAVSDEQGSFVAPNAVSIAQAYFEKRARFRAIYRDDTPVGFAMLYADSDKPEYYLWRFMIDVRFQRLGLGRRAMELVIAHVKTLPNANGLTTSVVQAEGGPQGFFPKASGSSSPGTTKRAKR